MQPPSPTAPSSSSNVHIDEFRDQWKQEINNNKKARSNLPDNTPFVTSAGSPPLRPASGEDEQSLHIQAYSIAKLASDATLQDGASSDLSSPLDMYLMGIETECQGEFGQALTYYRHAFKLDPDVAAVYHRQCDKGATTDADARGTPGPSSWKSTAVVSGVQQKQPDPLVATGLAESSDVAALLGHSHHDNYLAAQHHLNPRFVDTLDSLAYEMSQQDTSYIPALDYKPVAIARLPGEILVHILGHAILHSVSATANFALVCKRFFLVTRSPTLWRHVCEHVFCMPGMTLKQSRLSQAEFVAMHYEGHWLQMYMERPRLHFDGVYISVRRYIRPGESDISAWTQPVHLVTYYRYIRFFPDGSMVKYLSTETPDQVVRLLDSKFSRRQVFHGHYHFTTPESIVVEMRDRSRPRHKFEMTLNIKSTRRGRHNKLVWQKYWNQKEGREEGSEFDLAFMKPFLFSVVRSFRK